MSDFSCTGQEFYPIQYNGLDFDKYVEGPSAATADYNDLSGAAGKMVAEIYFRIAAMGYSVASSLTNIIEGNVNKLSVRIRNNTIDKPERQQAAGVNTE